MTMNAMMKISSLAPLIFCGALFVSCVSDGYFSRAAINQRNSEQTAKVIGIKQLLSKGLIDKDDSIDEISGIVANRKNKDREHK